MNALQLLKQDHEKVRKLFSEYDAATAGGNSAAKEDIARRIFQELRLHSHIEEEVFYPAFDAKASGKGKELVSDSYEDHATVDDLIGELEALSPSDGDYDDKFEDLMESVEHHIEEEESELFPEAERRLGSELDQLGRKMEEEKSSATL